MSALIFILKLHNTQRFGSWNLREEFLPPRAVARSLHLSGIPQDTLRIDVMTMLVDEGFYYCNLYWPGIHPGDPTFHGRDSCWVELNNAHVAEQAREKLDGLQFRGRSLRATFLVCPQPLFYTPRSHKHWDINLLTRVFLRPILVLFCLQRSPHNLSNTTKQVMLRIQCRYQPRAHLYRVPCMILVPLTLPGIQIGSSMIQHRQRSMRMSLFPQPLPSLRLL